VHIRFGGGSVEKCQATLEYTHSEDAGNSPHSYPTVPALLVLLAAMGGIASADTLEPPSPADTSFTDESSADASPTSAPTDPLGGVIITRTPEPTATPGRIEQQVEALAETVGLARTTFLGRR
jgi:hypothetical protein